MTDEVKNIITECKHENIFTVNQGDGLILIESYVKDKTGQIIKANGTIDNIARLQIFDHLVKKALDYYLPLIELKDGEPSPT